VIGVYGVMAYVVSTRSTEMGIRRALGAQGGDILGLVLGQSARLAGLGAVIGVGLSLLMAQGLSRFLLGVSPFDPVVFGGVTLTLVAAALGATVLPARRASTVAPTEALRAD
jgi:ABC-type antimicrobial peptide transport system permease subunit